MKKFITAILAVLYISTSTGAMVHMHYCMGQLADWGLGHNKSKTCSKCGMEKSDEKDNGCCKDEHKFIKNDTDQKAAEAGFQMIQLFATAIPVSFVEIPSADFPTVTEENPISHAPPRSGGVAVYVRNCTFLI
ncbi:MAG: hypothetical protein V9F01_04525 [Chitinophagaceae bacterium]|nr:hypothetical protein [Ferruginibacter sp.]